MFFNTSIFLLITITLAGSPSTASPLPSVQSKPLPPPEPQAGKLHLDAADTDRSTRDLHCDSTNEYIVKDHCCRACPAGTYVEKGCPAPHSENSCKNCTRGEGYTAGPNALSECNRCTPCRTDQVMIHECTPEKDTQCECKPGYYCPEGGACELCQQCKNTCPKGQEPQMKCSCRNPLVTDITPNSSLPIVPSSEHWITAGIIIGIAVIGIIIIAGIWYCWKTRGCSCLTSENGRHCERYDIPIAGGETGTDEQDTERNQEIPLSPEMENSSLLKDSIRNDDGGEEEEDEAIGNSVTTTAFSSKESVPLAIQEVGVTISAANDGLELPESSCLRKSAFVDDEGYVFEGASDTGQEDRRQLVEVRGGALRDSFYIITKEVPHNRFKQLMRNLRLRDNEIQEAVVKDPKNVTEQNYNMLVTWHEKTGKDASINVILEALYSMELKGVAEEIIMCLIREGLYKNATPV